MSSLIKSTATEETQAIVAETAKVFSTYKKPTEDETSLSAPARRKKNERPQLVVDYLTMMFKLSNNAHLLPNTRVNKLDEWARKFRTGYPRKNSQEFVNRWTPVLQQTAEALSKQIVDIEKAKYGRNTDVGHISGPDQKQIKDATIADFAVAKPAEATKTK